MPNAMFVYCRDPFRRSADRQVSHIERPVRLDSYLRSRKLLAGRGARKVLPHPYVIKVNGEPLLQAKWHRVIRAHDTIECIVLPQGGGGSNILSVVALVALTIAAPGIGAAYGATLAGATGLSVATATSLISAGVIAGGSLILSAIIPPPRTPTVMQREAASPTYTISSQGNTARLLESIPRVYGRFRTFPDLASQPYTENVGNQQFLYQLFCVSQGQVDIEAIRIEDTDITNYAEVEYEVIPPGGSVTLFPDNVVTSPEVTGIELKGSNEEGYPTDGWFGGIVSAAAGTEANYIGIDINLPQGLFYANNNGSLSEISVPFEVQGRRVDGQGNPITAYETILTKTITSATPTPQMLTYRIPVTPGRWQIRARRVGEKNLASQAANTLVWSGLRAYLPSTNFFGNVTMIAMVIRATNNLNSQTARKVNVISIGKVPVWDGTTWSAPQPTTNPAWILADIFRNTTYGRGMPDRRINLPELLRLSQVWAARGDEFNGVFDTAVTIWEAATTVARVGRAMPMYYAGIIDFIRNEPRSMTTAMFTPDNIVAGSLSINYKFPNYSFDAPDHVEVEYIDRDTWAPATVKCVLPGMTQLRPVRLTLMGCTDRDQAWREGISLAASNRDQRRFISITTEMDGYIPKYADRVKISHDVPQWGRPGNVIDYAAGVIETSEPLEWSAGEIHYMAFRRRDGSADGPYVVTAGVDDFHAVVAGAPSLYVSDGTSEDPTFYVFGPGERVGLDALMISARPRDNGQVEISAVNYAESVYTAEDGGNVPPPPPASLLPGISAAPVVSSVVVVATPVAGQQAVTATPARGAVSYQFEASTDNATWVPLGETIDPTLTINLAPGYWYVRARAIGVLPGPWALWQGDLQDLIFPPGTPMLTLESPFIGTTLRVNVNNATGLLRNVTVTVDGEVAKSYQTPDLVIVWTYEDARVADAIAPVVTISVQEVNQAGMSAPATITATNPPADVAPMLTLSGAASITVTVTDATADYARTELRSGSAEGAVVLTLTGGPGTTNTSPYLPGNYYGMSFDVWGNRSPVSTITIAEEPTGGD